MVSLKDYIISTLPDYIKSEDSYKDVNQKGFVVRYLEIFGEELDDEYYTKLEALLNEWDPKTISNPGYLDYIAFLLGDTPNFALDEAGYRNLLTFLASIYKVKGTKKSFKAILYPAGIVVTDITNVVPTAINYDSGVLYDQVGIFYDQNCKTCSDYEITMTSALTLTADLFLKINSLIALVEPLNANRSKLTYNGGEVTEVIIEVFIDEFGDLQYENAADPGLILTLSPDGDLIISGPNASRYYINNDGDLVYILY